MSWLTGNWSPPLRLSEIDRQEWWRSLFSGNEAYLGGGVYRLIGLENVVDWTPAIIRRVCSDDTEGTLYIGASDTLFCRVASLIITHQPDYSSAPHKPLMDRMAAQFPANKLAVSWELSSSVSPWERERELLDCYGAEFGELPPHNRR
jgi:hypothetical protein